MIIKKLRRWDGAHLLVYPQTFCEWLYMTGRAHYISFTARSGKTAWLRKFEKISRD